jgi:nitrite reductase/ring-hydroxylating ferredoxin subunit
MLDDHRILARSVRVVTQTGPPDARGKVIAVNENKIVILDELLTELLHFRVTEATQVQRNGQAAPITEVQAGSQIAVHFSPEKANRDVAQTIVIIAAAGEIFTFAGRVTHLDLHLGTLAVENRTDSRTYDIFFDPEAGVPSNLMVGSEVRIAAAFDGHQYKANQINVSAR